MTSHSYSIGVLGGPTSTARASFIGRVEITKAEYEKYDAAATRVLRLTDQLTFRLVERNYYHLSSTLTYYDTLFAAARELGRVNPRDAGFFVVGQLVNWLTSVRLFLDHQETELNRLYGVASTELKRFKAATSKGYDASPAYRILDQLRNYVLHCGLPVSEVSLQAAPQGEPARQRIVFLLNREELLSNFRWKKVAAADLRRREEKFAVLPLIEEMMPHLREIARETWRIHADKARPALSSARKALDLLGDVDGDPILIRFTYDDGGAIRDIAHRFLMPHLVAGLEQLSPEDDPVALYMRDAPPRPPVDPAYAEAMAKRTERGVAVLAAWTREGGGTAQFFRDVDHLIEADGDIEPVMTGVINVGTYFLAMLSQALGTSRESLLGGLAAYDREPLSSDEPTGPVDLRS